MKNTALIFGLLVSSFSYAGSDRIGVSATYSSLSLTLSEPTQSAVINGSPARGQVAEFCRNYLAGHSEVSSTAHDLLMKCTVTPVKTKLEIGIGYTANTVSSDPAVRVVLVESLATVHGLTSSAPFRGAWDDHFGNHVRLKLSSDRIEVHYMTNRDPHWETER